MQLGTPAGYQCRGGMKSCAFRSGKFKWVENRNTKEQWLFNLEEDISEKNNLLKQHPEIADYMRLKF